tara:strand:+ start:255 stop:764 length:510 start_codon:yes stop_codon:yes gene_type:complete
MKINVKRGMKLTILTAILFSLLVTSCKKEDYIPYELVEENNQDTTQWQSSYSDGGTITNGTYTNDLLGTKWVLTKYVSAFATEYPNDTIEFISVNTYELNGSGDRTYNLSNIPSSTNYDLTLNYFSPFGGSHYSGNVGYYFVDDGEINNVEFTNIQNTSMTIRAWFEKI